MPHPTFMLRVSLALALSSSSLDAFAISGAAQSGSANSRARPGHSPTRRLGGGMRVGGLLGRAHQDRLFRRHVERSRASVIHQNFAHYDALVVIEQGPVHEQTERDGTHTSVQINVIFGAGNDETERMTRTTHPDDSVTVSREVQENGRWVPATRSESLVDRERASFRNTRTATEARLEIRQWHGSTETVYPGSANRAMH
jgi:hypothetical protein